MDAPREMVDSTREPARGISRRALTAITAALVVSVVLNVELAHRLQTLNVARSARRAELLVKIGATVPPISAKRLDGQPGVISYQDAEQSTVLYIFTPPCSWCARNMSNLKTLLDQEGSHYRFIGVSLSEEGLAQYVLKNDLKLPIYSGLSSEVLKTYKLGSTPQTIVVSPEGKVLQDWVGAYVGDQKSQIEAFFHVALPGLRELPKAEAAKN
jgi:peroxiredoxin